MSQKRTSAEYNNDEQPNEGSDSLSQQGNNAKRAKLIAVSDTTLQDLPMELIECILVKVVAMEVKGMKLAKSVWKEKAELVISRLRTVCLHWSNILTTNFFRNELHRTLERTAPETIRLEILHMLPIPFCVFRVTATRDEMFMIGRENDIIVYNRNTMAEVKDAIALMPGTLPWDIAACNMSNCVYVLGLSVEYLSMLRITKDEKDQFNVSPWINDLSLSVSSISVSVNGSLIILSGPQRENPAGLGLSIYDVNGYLQHKIMLSPGILGFTLWHNVIQKSNGNIVLVSLNDHLYSELTEVDAAGSIVLQYKSSLTVSSGVHFADIHGRFVITEADNKIRLFDSELNLLEFTGPLLKGSQLHYNCDRNEVVGILSVSYDSSVLTTFRFTEE